MRIQPDGVTVEALLERFQAETAYDPERPKQLAAIRYYLQRILGFGQENGWRAVHRGITNYKTLLDQLRQWQLTTKEKICFVTFNYDTMLESACAGLGMKFESMDDYIRSENIKIIKPHGSVDWLREINTDVSRFPSHAKEFVHLVIEKISLLDVSDRYRLLWQDWPAETRGPGQAQRIGLFPAIAIPLLSKSSFECPSGHLEALRTSLPEVSKLITIGWAGKERHFLDLLAKHPGSRCRGMAIAANSSEAMIVCHELAKAGIGDTWEQGRSGFTDAVVSGEILRFLSRAK